jgi:hypothetical protein
MYFGRNRQLINSQTFERCKEIGGIKIKNHLLNQTRNYQSVNFSKKAGC